MFKCFFVPAFIFFFLEACTNSSASKIETDKIKVLADSVSLKNDSSEKKTSYNTNNIYNNITSILCGNKGQSSNLNYLFDTLAWKKHAEFIDSCWVHLEKKRLRAMKDWGRKEFAKPNAEAKTVFYPFSGPDFLTANAFFPNADKYIMLGLESVGKLPDLQTFKPGDAGDYANDFKKSLNDIFDKSYFITQKMISDFQAQKVNGLLPLLAFFIKKTGNDIIDIKYFVRFAQDSLSLVNYNYKNNNHKPFGVKVDFLQDNKLKSVYYFKYDVSNKLFNDTTIFYKFIKSNTQNCITYIKSASYLLHANFMANMRSLILKNSIAVIEDDTGIPYKYFEDDKSFTTKFYGQYTKPVKDFPYLKLQKPLIEALHRDSAKVGKLPFHLGYHWQSKKDIIIFATRN